jgi:hypothetical protein
VLDVEEDFELLEPLWPDAAGVCLPPLELEPVDFEPLELELEPVDFDPLVVVLCACFAGGFLSFEGVCWAPAATAAASTMIVDSVCSFMLG